MEEKNRDLLEAFLEAFRNFDFKKSRELARRIKGIKGRTGRTVGEIFHRDLLRLP